jgi:hypothetical protein
VAETTTEAPADQQDTPTTDTEPQAPEETPDTPQAEDTPSEPEVDYAKRYDDLRSEFDRRNAALAGQLGPEAQAEAFRQYGLELAEDDAAEDEDEYLDPDERINRLEEALKERDEIAEQQDFERRENAWIQQQRDKAEKDEDRKFASEEWDFIESFALGHRFDDGQPDIEGGIERLKAVYSAHQKRLVDSKKNAPKPPSGVPGDEKLDTSTPEGRRQAIEQVASASIASEE